MFTCKRVLRCTRHWDAKRHHIWRAREVGWTSELKTCNLRRRLGRPNAWVLADAGLPRHAFSSSGSHCRGWGGATHSMKTVRRRCSKWNYWSRYTAALLRPRNRITRRSLFVVHRGLRDTICVVRFETALKESRASGGISMYWTQRRPRTQEATSRKRHQPKCSQSRPLACWFGTMSIAYVSRNPAVPTKRQTRIPVEGGGCGKGKLHACVDRRRHGPSGLCAFCPFGLS
ncbi:hypothetical protein LZ30DRAFT_414765 [Colletotrichum cereale]|nr:hypothetical protein LZ30DRAFT_414765 [Colletotrichum cereale]